MPLSREAVAERNRREQEQFNRIGWYLATTLGIALACGIGKMVVDLKNTHRVRGRKPPWQLG
jgi:hypothetical protein